MRLYPESPIQGPVGTRENTRQTGVWENMKAGAYNVWTEDRPLMSHFVDYGPDVTASLEEKLQGARRDSIIPESVFDNMGDDLDGISNWANMNKIEGFQSRKDIKTARLNEHNSRKAEYARISEQAGLAGKTASFISATGTYLTEPLYVLPGLGTVGATTTIGSAIIKTALIEGAAATVGQIPKWQRKDELQVKYDANDMLLDVVFTAIGSAAFTGIGMGIKKGVELKAGQMARVLRTWSGDSKLALGITRPLRNTFEKMDADMLAKDILEQTDTHLSGVDNGSGVKSQAETNTPPIPASEADNYFLARYEQFKTPAKGAPPASASAAGKARFDALPGAEPPTSGAPEAFVPDMPEGWETRHVTERVVPGETFVPTTSKEKSDALRLKMEGEQVARNVWVRNQLKKNVDEIEAARTSNSIIDGCLGKGAIS